MTRIELRVTFPKSVEVFGWRKNGVKLMRRKSFVETRDTVAAVDVTGVYALPGYYESKYLKKNALQRYCEAITITGPTFF